MTGKNLEIISQIVLWYENSLLVSLLSNCLAVLKILTDLLNITFEVLGI